MLGGLSSLGGGLNVDLNVGMNLFKKKEVKIDDGTGVSVILIYLFIYCSVYVGD